MCIFLHLSCINKVITFDTVLSLYIHSNSKMGSKGIVTCTSTVYLLSFRYRKDFHFAMSDDEENDKDIKSFGFDDSGSDFSLGCYGTDGNRYPMEELDEWEQDEVCEVITAIIEMLSY